VQHPSRNHGHATGPQRMGFGAQGDRAGAGEDVVRLVVALVDVRRAFGDFHDVNVRHPAFAARHDPLDVPIPPLFILILKTNLLLAAARALWAKVKVVARKDRRCILGLLRGQASFQAGVAGCTG